MKINDIFESTTSSGSIAPVAAPLGGTRSRAEVGKGVYKTGKVGNLLTGKASKKKYANSLSEGKMKDIAQDLEYMDNGNFQKKYKASKDQIKAKYNLKEDDFILVPGKGNKLKTGLHSFDPDKAEHEGETLKNSLRTIARVASDLNKRLDDQDNFPEWVSEKVGAIKSMMTGVMQYLASEQEADHAELDEFGAGVIAGGGVGEGRRPKVRLDPFCQDGYHKEGTKIKKGTRVNNCIPNESMAEDSSRRRPDHEISMAKGEMRSAFDSAKKIYKMLDSRGELMAWQQSYITLASDYLDSVADSMKQEQTHGSSVAEGAGKLHPMQKTINFAKKNGYEVKISPKGTRVSFYNPRYDHSVKTSIYKDGEELWVNFHDEDSGMSGNDPIGDFYGTFANAVERNGMYADDSEEDDDMHEGAKVDRMVRHIKSSEKKSGKSDKAAENIAWATLNKRGMLDNANKKKGK